MSAFDDRYRPIELDKYRLGDGATDIAFVELSPPMAGLPLSPSFILGSMLAADSASMFATTQTGPAGYYVVRNVLLTHDGIMLHGSTLLTSLITNFPEQHCLHMVRHVSEEVLAKPPRVISGRSVLLVGPGVTTWGHWLIDFLPRLFLLDRAGWEISKLQWIITKQTPRFARELLHLLGLPEACLVEYDPAVEMLKVDEVIIPTNLSAGPLMHPLFNEVVAWFKRRLHPVLVGQQARPRIFLSRSSVAFQRMLGNRDVIETIARAAGYHVVDPARLSVPEQLALFYGATRIAGEYGSGLHTSIFAAPGSIVLCLRGPQHTAGVLQNGLAKACSQKIGYVFGEPMEDSPIEAFTLSPDLFRLAVEYAELAC